MFLTKLNFDFFFNLEPQLCKQKYFNYRFFTFTWCIMLHFAIWLCYLCCIKIYARFKSKI